MKKDKLYIAYGSNLNLPQMSHRCPTAEVVCTGEVKDYELLFRGGKRGAVATIEPLEGSSVPVLLWKIKLHDELALDRYEGLPHLYRKEIMDVDIGNKTVSAMVYVMNDGRSFGVPSDFYRETIEDGYKTAGFDLDFLEQAVDKSIWLSVAEQEAQEQRDMELEQAYQLELDDPPDTDQTHLWDFRWR